MELNHGFWAYSIADGTACNIASRGKTGSIISVTKGKGPDDGETDHFMLLNKPEYKYLNKDRDIKLNVVKLPVGELNLKVYGFDDLKAGKHIEKQLSKINVMT